MVGSWNPLFTSLRIRIRLFTLVRNRIRIPHQCDVNLQPTTGSPRPLFEPSRSSMARFEPLKLLNFDFREDPDLDQLFILLRIRI
jgi:hypothetical protein